MHILKLPARRRLLPRDLGEPSEHLPRSSCLSWRWQECFLLGEAERSPCWRGKEWLSRASSASEGRAPHWDPYKHK